jgi:hypothetical protein
MQNAKSFIASRHPVPGRLHHSIPFTFYDFLRGEKCNVLTVAATLTEIGIILAAGFQKEQAHCLGSPSLLPPNRASPSNTSTLHWIPST